MCTLILTDDGGTIETVAALRELWPVLIAAGGGVLEPSDDEAYCLCGIDVPGSARVNRYRANYDPSWGEYRIRRRIRSA